MSPPTYSAAIDRLLALADFERKSRAGEPPDFHLRRMERLLSSLGHPHLTTPTVHVAGSKGKGSTSALIASVLTAHGLRTGLYTSPHLHTFRERIRADGQPIAPDDFARLVYDLWPHVEAVGTVSLFELLTAMAFAHFRAIRAEAQVIEVGLGGRLDATNLVCPEVAVITNISLDHTRILGNTVAKIAAEKAGIIKAGTVVVTARQSPAARAVIEQAARDAGAAFVDATEVVRVLDEDANGPGPQRLTLAGRRGTYRLALPLLGEHQVDNARAAVAALEALADRGFPLRKEAVETGVSDVEWAGRAQLLPGCVPPVLVDGAHNGASAGALLQTVRRHFPDIRRVVLILAGSRGHDFRATARALSEFPAIIVATQTRHPRAVPAERLAEALLADEMVVAAMACDPPAALDAARRLAGPGDLVAVAGSLFLAAEVIEHVLGIEPELYPDLRRAADTLLTAGVTI